VLEVKNITKIYGTQRALDEVSFSVQPGEIVGLLGPNGAGKSTLMKIITCFIPPSEGEVTVYGHSIYDEPREVCRNIGYLPEQNPLYTDMYIPEFLRFTADIYKLSDSKKRVDEMIELTGLQPELGKKIGALSKGYRQRVGLAQAMIHDPKVLILDEPTTGLDPNQLDEIRKVIRNAGKNKIVLLSTHIMQEVEAMCGRAVIINHGKIVADGSIENLKSQGHSNLEQIFHQLTKE
jgi:ABC-2 type transport system ATP-binding protein